MIYVVSTIKESKRFPGKNKALLKYTLAWAAYAQLWTQEPVQIVVAAPTMPAMPEAVRYIRLPEGLSHRDALAHVQRVLRPSAGDVMVLAQVTQPLRSPELLARVVESLRASSCGSCVTAAITRKNEWRTVDSRGSWQGGEKEGLSTLHDGALYAWKPEALDEIFEPDTPHAVVKNMSLWGVVDIDLADDVPPSLAAMWAAVLLEKQNEL